MKWVLQHKILALGLIVALILALWAGIGGGSAPVPLTSEDVELEGGPVESTVDRELVETLLALRAVTLSGSIFQDIAFQSLKDFGTPIMPEPIGRENPFAPLSGRSGASSDARVFEPEI
ncbi:MAG TPA: hypothetical protein VJB97_04510 [Candidatus Paceibacterota bacterium]